MVDPSRGSSENVLKLITQISFFYRKLNVQGRRLKISFHVVGEAVISFTKIQWVHSEDYPFFGIHTQSLCIIPSLQHVL
jgi:hypothetical protein